MKTNMSAKFPSFFDNPIIRFAQIYAIFEISRIKKDSTKYLDLSDFQEYFELQAANAYKCLK